MWSDLVVEADVTVDLAREEEREGFLLVDRLFFFFFFAFVWHHWATFFFLLFFSILLPCDDTDIRFSKLALLGAGGFTFFCAFSWIPTKFAFMAFIP